MKSVVCFALRHAACWSVGLDAHGDVPRAIGPLARHCHDPIGHLSWLAQILLSSQRNAMPALGIAGFSKEQNPGWVWPQIRVCLPQLQTPAVDRLGVPRGSMHEVMHLLSVGARHQGRQRDHRLVVFPRQEQSNELGAEGLPPLPSSEQYIKGRTELLNRLGGRGRRLARSGHGKTSITEQNTAQQQYTPLLILCLCLPRLDQPAMGFLVDVTDSVCYAECVSTSAALMWRSARVILSVPGFPGLRRGKTGA